MSESEKEAMLLRIYARESEQWQGKPLHLAIVDEARSQGLAGATVYRGIEGFGLRGGEPSGQPAEPPLVIEIVDWEDRARSFLRTVDGMIEEGLVVTQKVQVAVYRSRT